MCAWLFSDGFDFYSIAADVTERWDSGSITNLVATASTAFGVGQAAIPNNAGLTKAWGSNDGTIYANIRHKQVAGTLAGNYVALSFLDGTNAQVTLRWNEDGSITVHSGGVIGTTLGTYSAAFASSAWDSWQVKIVIHNTTGSVEIRKNGSASPIGAALTGVNTRAGSTNAYANKLTMITSASAGNNHQVDDLFLNSGTGADPATWPGDLRAITNTPNATAQAQFSQSPSSTTWGQTTASGSSASGQAANTLAWYKVTAPFTGTVSQIAMNLAAAITGKLNVALYDDTAGAPGSLLAQGTEKTNPAAGTQTFALGSSQSVVKGASYWMAFWSNAITSSGFFNGGSGLTRMTAALTYSATFPSTGAGAGSLSTAANGPYFGADLTSISSASLVGDTTQDGDTSYVFSATVGQEDLYSFPSLASLGVTPAAITGVLPFAICKKSDSGARTIDVRAKSGVTDTQAATTASPSLSYSFLGGFLPTDPNTSAAWTTGGVDALQVGPKVAA